MKIPTPTRDILRIFADQTESITLNQIREQLPEYSLKDTKYALRRLREKGIIVSESNLLDMRRVFYRIATPEELGQVANKIKEDELNLYLSILENTEAVIA